MSAARRSPGARSSDPERVRGLSTQRGEASAFRVRNAEGGVQSDVQPFQLCLNTGSRSPQFVPPVWGDSQSSPALKRNLSFFSRHRRCCWIHLEWISRWDPCARHWRASPSSDRPGSRTLRQTLNPVPIPSCRHDQPNCVDKNNQSPSDLCEEAPTRLSTRHVGELFADQFLQINKYGRDNRTNAARRFEPDSANPTE